MSNFLIEWFISPAMANLHIDHMGDRQHLHSVLGCRGGGIYFMRIIFKIAHGLTCDFSE